MCYKFKVGDYFSHYECARYKWGRHCDIQETKKSSSFVGMIYATPNKGNSYFYKYKVIKPIDLGKEVGSTSSFANGGQFHSECTKLGRLSLFLMGI